MNPDTPASSQTQDTLSALRDQIDRIDDDLLALLNRRATLVLEVGAFKSRHAMELYVPSREKTIFERLAKANPGPFPTPAIRKVFREIISASLSLEHPMRVAFLGPRASFTHVSAMQQFGHSADLLSAKSIEAVFNEVQTGRVQYGVVPIENSNEGAVTHTLDLFLAYDLNIIAEHYLKISHDLLSRHHRLEDLHTLYSHPQALAQCRRWIEDHLNHVQVVEVESTARAAQIVADEAHAGAIASGAAANLYGLQVVASQIEDHSHNYTRFLSIGKKTPTPSGHDKTSLMFRFKDRPGILSEMLEPFRVRQLNLMKIESRPLKNKAWEYVFFVDVAGHADETVLKEALGDLAHFCTHLKVLGSYPRAR
jgi:chorismate mutase/prephenate dehydratase